MRRPLSNARLVKADEQWVRLAKARAARLSANADINTLQGKLSHKPFLFFFKLLRLKPIF